MNESKPTPSRATVCEACQAQARGANIRGAGRREGAAVKRGKQRLSNHEANGSLLRSRAVVPEAAER